MLNTEKLQELAFRVKETGTERLSELTGIRSRRLARFVSQPGSLTFPELEKVKAALQRVAADEPTP